MWISTTSSTFRQPAETKPNSITHCTLFRCRTSPPPSKLSPRYSQQSQKMMKASFKARHLLQRLQPLSRSEAEEKQSDIPQLRTQGSLSSKSTPVKGAIGGSPNRQKSIGPRPAEYSLSESASSAQSSQKGKKGVSTKHSEAMDFKEWCENECIRLIGSKYTSFLEFCLKQSREEAGMLLTENLGSYDPDREFIDKFLNYKDFLPADVFEIASKNRNDEKTISSGVGEMTYDRFGNPVAATDGDSKGGKNRGKKGKKVSPSVLGFNVISNRIMMGEIQTIED